MDIQSIRTPSTDVSRCQFCFFESCDEKEREIAILLFIQRDSVVDFLFGYGLLCFGRIWICI